MNERSSGWTGLAGFAGILLLIAGLFAVFQGLAALFSSSYYLVGESGLLVFDFTSWGWIHLATGVVLIATGMGIMAGQTYALVIGVIVAAIHAVAQIAFMSAYPVWATIVIALDVMIIYALATHGAFLREEMASGVTTTQTLGAVPDKSRKVG